VANAERNFKTKMEIVENAARALSMHLRVRKCFNLVIILFFDLNLSLIEFKSILKEINLQHLLNYNSLNKRKYI